MSTPRLKFTPSRPLHPEHTTIRRQEAPLLRPASSGPVVYLQPEWYSAPIPTRNVTVRPFGIRPLPDDVVAAMEAELRETVAAKRPEWQALPPDHPRKVAWRQKISDAMQASPRLKAKRLSKRKRNGRAQQFDGPDMQASNA